MNQHERGEKVSSTMVSEATRTQRGKGRRAAGEGSIFQRKDGRWVAKVPLPDGKTKSYYHATQREARDRLTIARREVQQGLPLPDNRQTLGTFLNQWLETVKKPNVRALTYRRYALDVKRISGALGKRKLSEVTPQVIQAFLNDLSASGLSPATVRHTRAVLRSALTQAENQNLIARNPAAGKRVTLPRDEGHEVAALSPEGARAIVVAFEHHPLGALVYTALATGLRQGELLGLRWQDVDLDGRTLTVRYQLQRIAGTLTLVEPKSKRSRRTLALPTGAVEILRAHRIQQVEARLLAGSEWRDTGHVFATTVGTPLDNSNVGHRFVAQLAKAGLPRMRFHDLRHGAASLLIAEGADLRRVMEQLGHSQISLTANTYAHLTAAVMRDNADRLGRALGGAG